VRNIPYIKNEQRPFIDLLVQLFLNDGNPHARLNYFIFKMTKGYMKLHGESYTNYKEIIGELEMCKQEIYRTMVAKYEDKKLKENGEI
jgi:hypothetical protein